MGSSIVLEENNVAIINLAKLQKGSSIKTEVPGKK